MLIGHCPTSGLIRVPVELETGASVRARLYRHSCLGGMLPTFVSQRIDFRWGCNLIDTVPGLNCFSFP